MSHSNERHAPTDPAPEASTAELVTQLSEQTSRLVRDEMRLAQAELKAKGKHAGVGAGLFGGAGLVAFFGAAALITTIIVALAMLVPLWLSALIVAVVLFIIAGIAALVGKAQVKKAVPPPSTTMESLKADVNEVKEHGHR